MLHIVTEQKNENTLLQLVTLLLQLVTKTCYRFVTLKIKHLDHCNKCNRVSVGTEDGVNMILSPP